MIKQLNSFGLLLLLVLFYTSCKTVDVNNQEASSQEYSESSIYGFTDTIGVKLKSYYQVDSLYSFLKFNLDSVRDNGIVSPVMINNITKSLSRLDVKTKKDVFIKMMLVHSLVANKMVQLERDSLIYVMQLDSLSSNDSIWLSSKKVKYRVKGNDLNLLLAKIDIIPPSLIIAQAITETGWGTSYFAYTGNCLFGEHTYSKNPAEYIKAKSSDIKMKKFYSLQASTISYFLNLNRNNAYKELRQKRLQLRKSGKEVDGYSLLKTLVNYSELGEEYINRVYGLMKYNELLIFDKISIIDNVPLVLIEIES